MFLERPLAESMLVRWFFADCRIFYLMQHTIIANLVKDVKLAADKGLIKVLVRLEIIESKPFARYRTMLQ